MSENVKEVEVKVYKTETKYTCDVEGCEGEVVSVDNGLTCLPSNPPQYPHVCNKCGARTTPYKVYPAIEIKYKEVE